MPKTKAAIGDILEINTGSGFGYAQYTHTHPDKDALIRILPGLYPSRPGDFVELAQQRELYFTFYPLKYTLPKGDTEIVSHQPIPDWAKPFPMLRHSTGAGSGIIIRADTLLTIENIRKAPRYHELTPELAKLSINSLWSHGLLAQRIAQGWTPERELEFQLKEIAEEEARKRTAPQPKVVSSESVRHYLYFPEKANAEKAAQWFRSQGFSVEVRLGADSENWLALVKHEAIEDVQDMEKLRDEMEALADRLHGEYDGWEAAV